MKKSYLKTPRLMNDFIYKYDLFTMNMMGMGEKPRNIYKSKVLLPTPWLDYSQILYTYRKSPLCIENRDDTTHTHTYIYIHIHTHIYIYICPVSCRIHWQHLCRGVRPPPNECPGNMTLNNLMVRFQQCWSFGECGVPLHCHRSQVHSGPEW